MNLIVHDPLKREKLQTDQRITATLNDPKLSEQEKHERYRGLYRKRKKLTKIIDEKPQRVIVEQKKEQLLPTTGVEEKPQLVLPKKEEEEEVHQEPVRGEEENAAVPETPKELKTSSLEKYKAIIGKKHAEHLRAYVAAHKNIFGVNERNEIIKNMTHRTAAIKSDYEKVLDYMTGHEDSIPKDQSYAATIFVKRLLKDENINALTSLPQQQGEGKRYVIEATSSSSAKTKRKYKRKDISFRPKIWTTIPT